MGNPGDERSTTDISRCGRNKYEEPRRWPRIPSWSAYLSAANRAANTARGKATSEIKRESKRQTTSMMNAWVDAWTRKHQEAQAPLTPGRNVAR